MEKRKLTKEDLDKVRSIEGFPIGRDEDIIALSDAPYYTACPNPFIEEFIAENGTPYDEETDDYHREPFAFDVSEGKGDAIYNAHSYHTKVPYKAIMRYILHYTNPGDIVFDGFCGTGMTGVASQMCGSTDTMLKYSFLHGESNMKWGARNAIISDLSPAATFVSANYNHPVSDINGFRSRCKEIFTETRGKYEWMYQTSHEKQSKNENGQLSFSFNGSTAGKTEFVIWSDVFICPNCGEEYIYWDVAVDRRAKKIRDKMYCPHCSCELSKRTSERAFSTQYDSALKEVITIEKQVPVYIEYSFGGSRYSKSPDAIDYALLEKIEATAEEGWFPHDRMCLGQESRRNDPAGITNVHHFFTKRNLIILSYLYKKAEALPQEERLAFLSAMRGAMSYGTKMVKVNIGRLLNGGGTFSFGAVTGTLYLPSITAERPILDAVENKIDSITRAMQMLPDSQNVLVGTGSLTDAKNVPSESIDYIFTDPPFGDNLNYSELNFLWESWQRVYTNNKQEAIVDKTYGKGILEYQEMMTQCFKECFRVLKPNRWITIEFHNSKNAVWNAIQEAIGRAGFVIADVRTLDKQQGSFKQTTTTSAVKQDLVISAYKPQAAFRNQFLEAAGTPESAWAFVHQHLAKIPVVVYSGDRIEITTERQAFLLFDRMVAYHIMQGLPVPIDALDFYKGLDERFLKRDGMYFLSDQVNEYDTARITKNVENVQFSFVVTNEKNAIQWLYYQLANPQTYAEIQPKFMQEVKAIDKFEAMPELCVLLEENFIQDEKGRWYVPDVTKEGDVAKLREKKLLKEFEGYLATKGKLRLFRTEAIRAGFAKLWADKNYKLIVETAERLPEQIIQEDDKLLMYYDISLGRV